MIIFVEIIIAFMSVVLGVLWISYPNENWEPWLVICAAIGGIVVAVLHLVRRRRSGNGQESVGTLSAGDALIADLRRRPLSEVLPAAISYAKKIGNADLERWCRLELYGYNEQGGMNNSDIVPEYRTVTGRWMDDCDHPFDASQHEGLSIVNDFRLRFGVKTLEELARKTEMQNIAHEGAILTLRQYAGFNAVRFCFSPVSVVSVIDAIKNNLEEKVSDTL